MEVIHHGAVNGVTGSCHELIIDNQHSVLVDCGMFQGAEESSRVQDDSKLSLGFSIERVTALLITHCHIDHVGRIPALIAAGFKGKIYCSEATAILLPLVLEDALKMGITHNRHIIKQFLLYIKQHLIPLPYSKWHAIPTGDSTPTLKAKFKPAGHILGSAYIECKVSNSGGSQKVIFSGDLGAPYTPLLPAPKAPWSADLVVLESTYGDRIHAGRKERRKTLKTIIEKALNNSGVILIPAFSIGRTQELLYELEEIIHRFGEKRLTKGLQWQDIDIVLDSPLAARFTEAYKRLRPYWDKEAIRKTYADRHPLSFEQLLTVDDHKTHLRLVNQLKRTGQPTIVIAGSGMCTGGRISAYLKALLGDNRTDVLFVGYQASGTPGREIQKYGPRGGYVHLDGLKVQIKATIHTIGGYSAHADQKDLLNFIRRMRRKPTEIRLVHGDIEAKQELKQKLKEILPEGKVTIGRA